MRYEKLNGNPALNQLQLDAAVAQSLSPKWAGTRALSTKQFEESGYTFVAKSREDWQSNWRLLTSTLG